MGGQARIRLVLVEAEPVLTGIDEAEHLRVNFRALHCDTSTTDMFYISSYLYFTAYMQMANKCDRCLRCLLAGWTSERCYHPR